MIPDDWRPNAGHRVFCESHGLDLEVEANAWRSFQHREIIRNPDGAFMAVLRKHAEARERQPRKKNPPPREDPIERFKADHPRDFERISKYLAQHRWWDQLTPEHQLEELRQAIKRPHDIINFLDEKGREF